LPTDDSAPRFSADGQTLYFLSTANGDPQVFTMKRRRAPPRTDFPVEWGRSRLSGNGHVLA